MLKLNFKRQSILERLLLTGKGKVKSEIKAETGVRDGIRLKRMHRREMLHSVGLATAALTTGIAIGACDDNNGRSNAGDNIDTDILNFALNLEYLEAEYYLRAIGQQLSDGDRGMGAGMVVGGSEVPFTSGSLIQQYANEIAEDELAHVRFLRSALGGAVVPAPDINFTDAFNAIGFDPFADEFNFLLGAFVFEDVGVTAYNGAAPLITDKNILAAAASILAVEAYHAGEIRVVLFALGQANPTLIDMANAISDARDMFDSDGVDNDQLITEGAAADGDANIVPTDSNGLAFSRTTDAVLRIVYLNSDSEPGGFFPSGLNGSIA
jgi:hypothetical protein